MNEKSAEDITKAAARLEGMKEKKMTQANRVSFLHHLQLCSASHLSPSELLQEWLNQRLAILKQLSKAGATADL